MEAGIAVGRLHGSECDARLLERASHPHAVDIVVIDQQQTDVGFTHERTCVALSPRLCSVIYGEDAAGEKCGNHTRKHAPFPGGLDTVMRPRWLATMLYEMDNPSPVPSPTGLVVKKGSKMRGRFSGAMPWPVSSISTHTWSSSDPVRIQIVP